MVPVPAQLTRYGYKCFVYVLLLSLSSHAPTLYQGGVMVIPAPGSGTCERSSTLSLLKAAAGNASLPDYCVITSLMLEFPVCCDLTCSLLPVPDSTCQLEDRC